MQKKAILIVSFGTLAKHSLENCIGTLMQRTKKEFPLYTVKNVFTSEFILRKRKGTEEIFSLREALETLVREKYQEVIILPTLLTAGDEYENKILKTAALYGHTVPCLKIGRPLLEPVDDIKALIRAFRAQIEPGEAGKEIVFMGHGSKNRSSDVYINLQKAVDDLCSDITIGVLEEGTSPSFDDVLERLRRKKKSAVYLMPLLFVAGMHVREDMIEGENSWRSRLMSKGVQVSVYEKGLGENRLLQDLYLREIAKLIERNGI